MKNINKSIFSIVLGLIMLTGCNKNDLQKDPTARIPPSTIFSTVENAYAAINGMHRLLYLQWYSYMIEGGQSGNMLYMEALGDDFVQTSGANGWLISEGQWKDHRSAGSYINRYNYGFYYVFIGNANEIIANIDGATGSATDRNFIKAQAYAYRAWAYFQMVQLFGKRYVKGGDNSTMGVPLVLEKTTGAVPRNSVEEVYSQINADLDESIKLFANAVARTHKSNININVAKGFKARVALTQENYADAAKYAKEARDGFGLMTGNQYLNSFVGIANPEWMWAIEQRDDQPTYFYSFYAFVGNFSSGVIRANPKAINSLLYAKIPATDIRKKLWDPTGKDQSFPLAVGGTRKEYMI